MEHKKKVWPPVIEIVETGERFVSIVDCARRIGGSRQGIYDFYKGKQKTYMGFTFRDLRGRQNGVRRL